MAKAAFKKKKKKKKKKKTLFTTILDLNLRKKLSKVLHLEHSCTWCSKMDTSQRR